MEAKDKYTLGLEMATDPRWADIAGYHIRDILIDHAWCEQKAASSCISLIIQYPDRVRLVETLTPIVAEEWDHFARVLVELKKRGFAMGGARKDEYIDALMRVVRKGGNRDQYLVEKLLMNAMVEARSCERFKVLWKHLDDNELSAFYHELMISEAGHYKSFLQLAKEYLPAEQVMERWREWLAAEAEILKGMAPRGDRMH